MYKRAPLQPWALLPSEVPSVVGAGHGGSCWGSRERGAVFATSGRCSPSARLTQHLPRSLGIRSYIEDLRPPVWVVPRGSAQGGDPPHPGIICLSSQRDQQPWGPWEGKARPLSTHTYPQVHTEELTRELQLCGTSYEPEFAKRTKRFGSELPKQTP